MKIRASDYQGVENIPDYVKTHPGTGDRIAHTETILSGYTPPADKAQCPEDFKFDMVKYRLMGLYGKIEPTFTLLTTRLEEANSNPEASGADRVDPAPIHYGLGLIYARKSRRDEALFHLKKALAVKIFDPMVLLEMGRIYLLNGEPEKALDVLTGLESDPILGLSARFHQADAHLELRHLATAESLLKTVIDKDPDLEPMAYFHLANIMSQEKKPGLSHFYLGLYYSKIDNPRTAVIHLKKSLESLDDEDKIKQANSLLSKLLKQSPKSTAQKASLFQ
jgi:tetratricopeptide (TPR) repeat protein